MRETVRPVKAGEGRAVYEDSDLDGIYRYDEHGKIAGNNRDSNKKYKSEAIPRKKDAEGGQAL